MSGCIPSVIVLGPSDAEITPVKNLLESHPKIHCGDSSSEYHAHPTELDFESYFKSFNHNNGKMFTYYDISSHYFSSMNAPLSIRSISPTTVFVVPLMDPVDRVISQYFSRTAKLPKSCYSVPIEDYLQMEIDAISKCDNLPVKFPAVCFYNTTFFFYIISNYSYYN